MPSKLVCLYTLAPLPRGRKLLEANRGDFAAITHRTDSTEALLHEAG